MKTALILMFACLLLVTVLVDAAKLPRKYSAHRISNRLRYPAHFQKNFLQRRSCIALGGIGCEGNNARCCREGNPYTGKQRKCNNVASFSSPKYVCVD